MRSKMGILIEFHPKFLERWARIYLEKNSEEGPIEAKKFADRTFTPEIVDKLIPVIHEILNRKK